MKKYLFTLLISISFVYSQHSNIEVKLTNSTYSNAKISYSVLSSTQLKVSVMDKNNEPIKFLKSEDFKIFDDGWELNLISAKPLSEAVGTKVRLIMCLDNSNSMESSVDVVIKILDNMFNSFSENTEVDFILFNEKGTGLEHKGDALNLTGKSFSRIDENVQDYYRRFYNENNLTTRTYLIRSNANSF